MKIERLRELCNPLPVEATELLDLLIADANRYKVFRLAITEPDAAIRGKVGKAIDDMVVPDVIAKGVPSTNEVDAMFDRIIEIAANVRSIHNANGQV